MVLRFTNHQYRAKIDKKYIIFDDVIESFKVLKPYEKKMNL